MKQELSIKQASLAVSQPIVSWLSGPEKYLPGKFCVRDNLAFQNIFYYSLKWDLFYGIVNSE